MSNILPAEESCWDPANRSSTALSSMPFNKEPHSQELTWLPLKAMKAKLTCLALTAVKASAEEVHIFSGIQ
jgi:hypothetical protein